MSCVINSSYSTSKSPATGLQLCSLPKDKERRGAERKSAGTNIYFLFFLRRQQQGYGYVLCGHHPAFCGRMSGGRAAESRSLSATARFFLNTVAMASNAHEPGSKVRASESLSGSGLSCVMKMVVTKKRILAQVDNVQAAVSLHEFHSTRVKGTQDLSLHSLHAMGSITHCSGSHHPCVQVPELFFFGSVRDASSTTCGHVRCLTGRSALRLPPFFSPFCDFALGLFDCTVSQCYSPCPWERSCFSTQ